MARWRRLLRSGGGSSAVAAALDSLEMLPVLWMAVVLLRGSPGQVSCEYVATAAKGRGGDMPLRVDVVAFGVELPTVGGRCGAAGGAASAELPLAADVVQTDHVEAASWSAEQSDEATAAKGRGGDLPLRGRGGVRGRAHDGRHALLVDIWGVMVLLPELGIGAVADRYDALLVDIWDVITKAKPPSRGRSTSWQCCGSLGREWSSCTAPLDRAPAILGLWRGWAPVAMSAPTSSRSSSPRPSVAPEDAVRRRSRSCSTTSSRQVFLPWCAASVGSCSWGRAHGASDSADPDSEPACACSLSLSLLLIRCRRLDAGPAASRGAAARIVLA